MMDIILSIAIFHGLCTIALICAVSFTALQGLRRQDRPRRRPGRSMRPAPRSGQRLVPAGHGGGM
ncbi:MAG: hypothetical protein RLZZ200_1218 [Pseudomonadota bacterium]|jgi:hypothetical protein